MVKTFVRAYNLKKSFANQALKTIKLAYHEIWNANVSIYPYNDIYMYLCMCNVQCA